MHGNYVNLTNLTDEDIDRIIEMRISPINVSVHTTDPDLRVKMMKNKRAGEVLDYIRQVAEAGIKLRGQIVLCRGVNDGDELDYIVRRLTPTECARLQGFPDWWCDDLGIEEPTMDDIRYWYDVFETHRRIVGGSSKPKSLKQISKWLREPHSDAAEYKMWGNGVALPCVVFVLSGIVWCTQNETENSRT